MQALVSVVIPIYNIDPDLFSRTISSVKSQSLESFECIVVDESPSSDNQERCQNICELDPRIRYIRPPQRMGIGASLNLGFQLSEGCYLARLDGDDFCSPKRFERQVSFLEANSHIDVVGSWMGIVDSKDDLVATRVYPTTHEKIIEKFLYSNALGHPSVMLRRSLIRSRDGPYRTDLPHCEDLELWLYLSSLGHKFANIPERLLFYRQTEFDRPDENWRLNVKVRIQYLRAPRLPSKLFFIFLLAIWSVLPKKLRSFVYKGLHHVVIK
jgi:glycosyltransferase involved in cell wall biosynthesis